MKKARLPLYIILALVVMIAGCGKGTKVEPPVQQEPTTRTETTPDSQPPKSVEETPVSKGDITFERIYFDFDKYNLKADAVKALNGNAKVLMDNSEVRIRIEGHCDERGTIEYNLALGEKRALAAKDYLVKLGVNGSRIEIITFGEERPADPNSSEMAWSKNRRDEFIVISQ
ncbi:MAG: peptidoglycan-associated lipoprotein Pal [candidate division Zixibacteria bacterium]|nr:peptidoglycan-associated lipoprotein Pal [candidate division Zixibacteria bacterium]